MNWKLSQGRIYRDKSRREKTKKKQQRANEMYGTQ